MPSGKTVAEVAAAVARRRTGDVFDPPVGLDNREQRSAERRPAPVTAPLCCTRPIS